MPDRRQATSSAQSRSTGVRRNLFHQHLSRRPTTSSTSTSAETLRLDTEHESETSDIVIRDKNGDFEIVDQPMQSTDDQDEGGPADAREDESRIKNHAKEIYTGLIGAEERQRLAEAVKHHQRDRNRAPSEPAGEASIPFHALAKLMFGRASRSCQSQFTGQGGGSIRG